MSTIVHFRKFLFGSKNDCKHRIKSKIKIEIQIENQNWKSKLKVKIEKKKIENQNWFTCPSWSLLSNLISIWKLKHSGPFIGLSLFKVLVLIENDNFISRSKSQGTLKLCSSRYLWLSKLTRASSSILIHFSCNSFSW